MLETIERETGPNPQWTMIWLPGLGSSGHDLVPLASELTGTRMPAMRFVFVQAPVRQITINQNTRMRGWYDITSINLECDVDWLGIDHSVGYVQHLIREEIDRGIPAQQIFLAGFSQGGAITLCVGLGRRFPLAGLVSLSSYLPGYEAAIQRFFLDSCQSQPIFMAHGSHDSTVPLSLGERSAQCLRHKGFFVTWRVYPMGHQVSGDEMVALSDWLATRIGHES